MWQPLEHLRSEISLAGGFVNAHAHFDRAYSVKPEDFAGAKHVEMHLHEKWKLVDAFKSNASEELYFSHIWSALQHQQAQGVKACCTFIDCDPIAGTRALNAALKAKVRAKSEWGLPVVLACQTLKGVLEPTARQYFEASLEFVDIIGGLPGADKGFAGEHIDVLFAAAKRERKRVHVHVDQLNCASEKETELLARKVMAHGMEGQVTAVHGISIAAHKKNYRDEVYKMCRDAGLSFIACPTAWIDARRSETEAPTHNAVTPIDEMIPAGLIVAIGSDNISDVYKPFANGDMLTELRVLLEATHFYDVKELTKLATFNGLKVLGLD